MDGHATPTPFACVSSLGLPYMLTLPDGSDVKQSPVLLHLHGAASRGAEFREFDHLHSSAKCEAPPDFILVRPQCPEGKEWTTPKLRMQVMAMLDDVIKAHAVDKNRIFLSGASMGGDAVWALGSAFPSRFAALVPICAGEHLSAAPSLRHTPVWVFHSVTDSVYPVSGADAMVAALAREGNSERVRYSRLADCATPESAPHAVGHGAWLDALAHSSELWHWLREQHLAERHVPMEPIRLHVQSRGGAV